LPCSPINHADLDTGRKITSGIWLASVCHHARGQLGLLFEFLSLHSLLTHWGAISAPLSPSSQKSNPKSNHHHGLCLFPLHGLITCVTWSKPSSRGCITPAVRRSITISRPWNPQVMSDSNHPGSASLNHHGGVLLRTVYLLIHRPHVQHVVFGHGRNHPGVVRVPANVADARKVPARVWGLEFRVWWRGCKVLGPIYSPSMDKHELWGAIP
jgi:hypothetical protein